MPTSLKENKIGIFMLLLIIAYGFSIAVKMIWVYQFQETPEFYWNNALMINTNDGYYYAEGARDTLSGSHQQNDLSPVDTPLSQLTALLAYILPFSFETIILWMPALFGSLIVVPVLLISRVLKQERAGFIAALLAGITVSYYNRTMVGYYDTDMLTVVLPALVLWSLIFNLQEQKNRFLLLIPVLIIAYSWWYGQSYSLNLAMAVTVLLYTLIFERHNLFNYKILVFMLIALSIFPWYYKLVAALALFLAFHYIQKANSREFVFGLLGAAILLVLLTGGLSPVLYQIKGYILREGYGEGVETLKLHFFSVNQTVREAGQIPFETFANRISGHTVTFLFSLVGYILLTMRYRVMLLALPMLGLGFIAMQGGLRFTVYAVPVMALGMGYFLLYVSELLSRLVFPKASEHLKRLFLVLAIFAVLYPNISHVIDYRVPTVFTTQEVEILDKLGTIADREDYVVTWWDFGYPIRYYSDVKTLVDGGKHTGKVNFPVSFALTHPPAESANMARMDVEYTERSFKERFSSNIIEAMKDYNATDINSFIAALGSKDFTPPQATRNIYFYLPMRMMNIFPTVALFSNIDLTSGQQKERSFFYASTGFKDAGAMLHLGNGVALEKEKGIITIGEQKIPLAKFITVEYDNSGTLVKQVQKIHHEGALNIIYMRSYNQFLLLDDKMLNSLYIQLFVLEEYDPDLFEAVILDPHAKVFKLKI
ncbi:MAG: peptide transporter [Campylobacterales bacterium]|nr:peptide transporter [Campylobacterales bacterium]